MRLTDEQVIQDNKRFANCNALAELKYCGWDIPHRKSITNDEIHFYAWLCRSAVALLKEREEIIHCKDCYYYHKPEFGFTLGDCTYRDAWYPVTENEFCSLAKRKEGR